MNNIQENFKKWYEESMEMLCETALDNIEPVLPLYGIEVNNFDDLDGESKDEIAKRVLEKIEETDIRTARNNWSLRRFRN